MSCHLMSFIQQILMDNFSVKFRVIIEKINVFGDYDNHIMFLSFNLLFQAIFYLIISKM